MNALPYLLQLFLGLLAFCALLKDWNDYGRLSQKWRKAVPLLLAILTVVVTGLGMYETHSDRSNSRRQLSRLIRVDFIAR